MTAFAASQRSKNTIKVCFGEALRLPRNFRAKMYSRTKRGDKRLGGGDCFDFFLFSLKEYFRFYFSIFALI